MKIVSVLQQSLLKDPNLRAAWANKLVYIYSGAKQAYWRAKGMGYTTRVYDVGVFDFTEAWKQTGDFEENDYIEYEEVRT